MIVDLFRLFVALLARFRGGSEAFIWAGVDGGGMAFSAAAAAAAASLFWGRICTWLSREGDDDAPS